MLKRVGKVHLSTLQVQLLLFVIFVAIGTLFANLVISRDPDAYQVLFRFFYGRIETNNIVKTDLLQYLMFNRFKMMLILWLIGFILFTPYINHCITSFLGFSIGLLFTTALLIDGFYGYGLVFTLLFPQCILYIPIYIYLLIKNSYFSSTLYRNRKTAKSVRFNGQMLLEYFLVLMICSVFLSIGVFMEAYMNPDLVKWYISLN